jgi:hypothetical protein
VTNVHHGTASTRIPAHAWLATGARRPTCSATASATTTATRGHRNVYANAAVHRGSVQAARVWRAHDGGRIGWPEIGWVVRRKGTHHQRLASASSASRTIRAGLPHATAAKEQRQQTRFSAGKVHARALPDDLGGAQESHGRHGEDTVRLAYIRRHEIPLRHRLGALGRANGANPERPGKVFRPANDIDSHSIQVGRDSQIGPHRDHNLGVVRA